jgi:hypothetical protein
MPALTVEQILADLDSRHEKTAAAEPAGQTEDPNIETHRQALDQALDKLTHETKTASAPSALAGADATAYLEKTAAEIEAAESHAIVKEAELFAGAFFHSFLNHANQYAEAAGTKVAAAQQSSESIEDHVKIAAQNGAADAVEVLQSAMQEKTAQDHIKQAAYNGADEMRQLLDSQAPAPAGQFQHGVSDTVEKVAELCSDAFNRGYAAVEAVVNQ